MKYSKKSGKILFPSRLSEGTIIRRPNRFIVEVLLQDGSEVRCYCPATGRIGGFTLDGFPCLVSGPYDLDGRSTEYTLEAFAPYFDRGNPDFQWVGVNQTLANRVAETCLLEGIFSSMLPNILTLGREKSLEGHRIDFFINGDTYLEVKMPLTYIDVLNHDGEESAPNLRLNFENSRMSKQLSALTRELETGKKAILLAFFAYDFADGDKPRAVQSEIHDEFQSLERAFEAGLESWRCHFVLDADGFTPKFLLRD